MDIEKRVHHSPERHSVDEARSAHCVRADVVVRRLGLAHFVPAGSPIIRGVLLDTPAAFVRVSQRMNE